MPFNLYELCVQTECSSNDIEMAEDDHVTDNTDTRIWKRISIRDHGERRALE